MQRTNYRAPRESVWSTCTRFSCWCVCLLFPLVLYRGLCRKVCHMKSNTAIETETKAKSEKRQKQWQRERERQRGKSKSKRIKSNLIIQIEITNQHSWHVDKRRRQRHHQRYRRGTTRRLNAANESNRVESSRLASRIYGWESRIRSWMRTRDLHFQNRIAT